jgi:hypothetical protein
MSYKDRIILRLLSSGYNPYTSIQEDYEQWQKLVDEAKTQIDQAKQKQGEKISNLNKEIKDIEEKSQIKLTEKLTQLGKDRLTLTKLEQDVKTLCNRILRLSSPPPLFPFAEENEINQSRAEIWLNFFKTYQNYRKSVEGAQGQGQGQAQVQQEKNEDSLLLSYLSELMENEKKYVEKVENYLSVSIQENENDISGAEKEMK